MSFEEFSQLCAQLFSRNQMQIPSEKQTELLFRLTEIMLETNRHMNLTAITNEAAVISRHYIDSLTVSSLIPAGSTVIDIGCGAGFPALPLAIFRPDLTITAVDATAKRIAYVQSVVDALELTNCIPLTARAEEMAQNATYREQFDVATARAVASLPVLSELCLPFVKQSGWFIAMKSRQAKEELLLAKNAIATCGGKAVAPIPFVLSPSDAEPPETRLLIPILKISPTPKNFPRHFSKISKKPL